MEGIVPPYSSFGELREAVRFGYIEDVRSKLCVIRISDPTKPLSKFSRLLADAIQHRHLGILELLLLERIPITSDAVKAAAEIRCHEALSMLFNHGWDINQPLSGDQPPVLSNVLYDFELVTWLLERGADPNAGCDVDETPLSHAVAAAPRPTVQALLKKAATLEKGQLIHCAVDREIPDPELIEILAENGAPYEDILWQDAKSFRYRGHFTRGSHLRSLKVTRLHRQRSLDGGIRVLAVKWLLLRGRSIFCGNVWMQIRSINLRIERAAARGRNPECVPGQRVYQNFQ
ncbi:hypothetical protein LTR33_002719 [Friedmanniomyces endolithicus]|nr:hypothetical protein LTR33_002719 [Friedmanniomyces endolithicus]